MIETIASKHNLVCRQTVFNSILTSTLFVGFTIGSALGGCLSDKYGQVEIFRFVNQVEPCGNLTCCCPERKRLMIRLFSSATDYCIDFVSDL